MSNRIINNEIPISSRQAFDDNARMVEKGKKSADITVWGGRRNGSGRKKKFAVGSNEYLFSSFSSHMLISSPPDPRQPSVFNYKSKASISSKEHDVSDQSSPEPAPDPQDSEYSPATTEPTSASDLVSPASTPVSESAISEDCSQVGIGSNPTGNEAEASTQPSPTPPESGYVLV